MRALVYSLSGEVACNLASDIADLADNFLGRFSSFADQRTGSASSRVVVRVGDFEFRVFHGDLRLGEDVKLDQRADLEFVDFDAVGICAQVEADGNELNEDLLNKVQCHANQKGDQNLVHALLPASGAPVLAAIREQAIGHVTGHCR